PVRWDFEALEARFKITRLVMRERDVILICVAKVEGIVKESDFRYSRFDRDKKRLSTHRTVRLLQGDMPLEEPGARAGTIKVKASEEFRVVLDWARMSRMCATSWWEVTKSRASPVRPWSPRMTARQSPE